MLSSYSVAYNRRKIYAQLTLKKMFSMNDFCIRKNLEVTILRKPKR